MNPVPLVLDRKANTKRLIVASLNSIYDIFNIYGPMLNRAKLFFQRLQNDKSLEWDTVISTVSQREWENIVNQANSTPTIGLKRCVGERQGRYSLIAFTDASKSIYGAVIYLKHQETGIVSFLTAKSRVVNKQLETKTIPTLEFQAMCLGVETLLEIYQDLAGPSAVVPIKITNLELFSDSMVCLHWLNSYVHNYDKMHKRSVFVMNRLRAIDKMCQVHPVNFNYIEGHENPADNISRPVSYKKLANTNYFDGPKFLSSRDSKVVEHGCFTVTVPNPLARRGDEVPSSVDSEEQECITNCQVNFVTADIEHLVPTDKYSSFQKLVCYKICVEVYKYT